jgi:tetratricopeptide (TPR) repeat protein
MAKSKRKLNVKFLVAGAVVLCFMAAGLAYVYIRHVHRGNPAKWEALGKTQFAAGKYDLAYQSLFNALTRRQTDPELLTLVGDTWYYRTADDPDNLRKAVRFYDYALLADPKYLPALRAKLNLGKESLDVSGRGNERGIAAKDIAQAADHLLLADPTDRVAVKMSVLMPLELYLDGTPTDPANLEKAMSKCQTLAKNNPADSELPFYIARVRFQQAAEAYSSHQLDDANRRLAQAGKVMDDALKGQEQNPGMIYHAARMHLETAAANLAQSERMAALRTQFSQFKKAHDLVKPDDPLFAEIYVFYAANVRANPDIAPADRLNQTEAIYRAVLVKKPEEMNSRLALADILGRTGRVDDAIALISEKIVPSTPYMGVRGAIQRDVDNRRLMMLSNLEVDKASRLGSGAARNALLNDLQGNVEKLSEYGASATGGGNESEAMLHLRGRFELLKGQSVDGIKDLDHALQVNESSDGDMGNRTDIMFELATAYLGAGQDGEAQRLAQQIVANDPQYIGGQLLLAQILVREHDMDGAKPHIDALDSMAPNQPQVIALRLATYDPAKDQGPIHASLAKLPADDRDHKMAKAELAFTCHAYDVAEQLLKPLATAPIPDLQAMDLLAQVCIADNKKDQALAPIQAALAKDPNNGAIKLLQERYSGASAEQMQQSKMQLMGTVSDPFLREYGEAQLCRDAHDIKGWIQHLQAAEAIVRDRSGRDDERICLDLFQAYLLLHDWDNANKYEEILGKMDPNGTALSCEARYELARNQIDQANDTALKLTRERPEFSGSWVVVGLVKDAQGHYDEAVTSYLQALDRQVDNIEALRGLINSYYALNKPNDAKTYIDKAQKVLPNDPTFKEMAITWETTYGDPEKAIQPRMDALAATPGDVQAWINLARTYMAVARHEANRPNADPAKATSYYRRAADKLTEAIPKWPDDKTLNALLAGCLEKAGDYPSGEKTMLTWAARDKQKGQASTTVILTEFYAGTGHRAAAEDVLRNYIKTPHSDGSDAPMAVELSKLLVADGHLDQAMAVLPNDNTDLNVVAQRVHVYLAQNKPDDADKALMQAAGSDQLTPAMGDLKVQILLAANRPVDAKTILDKVLAADPSDEWGFMTRGKLTMDLGGDLEQATADLTHARDLDPDNMEVRLRLAEAERRRSRTEDAARELESALTLDPDNKQVNLRLLDIYIYSEPPRWLEAENLLTDMRKRPSMAKDTDVDNAEAILATAHGEMDRALAASERAVAGGFGNPTNDKVYLDTLLRSKQYDAVLTQSAAIAAKDHDPWWVHDSLAQAIMMSNKDRTAALAEFGKALDLSNADPASAQYVLQSVSSTMGFDEEISLVETRAAKDDQFAIFAAILRNDHNDTSDAVKWIDRALADYDKLSPQQRASVLRTAGALYLGERPPETRKAIDAYRKLLDMMPDDIVALNNLACLLTDPGPSANPQDAKQYSTRAYNLMTQRGLSDPSIMDTQGWVMINTGQVPDGVQLCRDALSRAKTDFPDAHYHLGYAYIIQNSPDLAVQELTQAQQLMDQAEKNNQKVDDLLRARVLDALHRAKQRSAG